MPRGIPNKPETKLADVGEKVEVTEVDASSKPEPAMYNLYVKGMRIQDIAEKFKVEVQEVLDAIKEVEQNR